GVDEHRGHRVGILDATDLQLRAAVEAEPAKPENQHAECRQRQVGTGNRIDLPLLAIFATPRTEQDDPGQRRRGTGQVDDAGAGEVLEAELLEETAAPGPVAL